jgi:hypothetical protein
MSSVADYQKLAALTVAVLLELYRKGATVEEATDTLFRCSRERLNH